MSFFSPSTASTDAVIKLYPLIVHFCKPEYVWVQLQESRIVVNMILKLLYYWPNDSHQLKSIFVFLSFIFYWEYQDIWHACFLSKRAGWGKILNNYYEKNSYLLMVVDINNEEFAVLLNDFFFKPKSCI